MTNDVTKRIANFNSGLNPELLKRKYDLMRNDVFSFFRGSCHLFYQDFPADQNINGGLAPKFYLWG